MTNVSESKTLRTLASVYFSRPPTTCNLKRGGSSDGCPFMSSLMNCRPKAHTLDQEHRWNSSAAIEVIAMSSSKNLLLIYRQLGQTRAVGSVPVRFRHTLSSRTPQSTLYVPPSRTTRRPFSYPYHLRTSSIRNIFIQTESTPNVDVSQPNL